MFFGYSKQSEVVILHHVSTVVRIQRAWKFGTGIFIYFFFRWGLISGPWIFLSFDFAPILSSPSFEIRSHTPTWGFY